MAVFAGAMTLGATIAFSILLFISWWIIYDKMGERGWKCLIPFYGRYVLFRRVWEPKAYVVSLVVSAFSVLLTTYELIQVYFSFMKNSGGDAIFVGSVGLFLLMGFFAIISFAIQMMLNWRISKCFRHDIGFFLGITFLPVVFVPILALGDSEYDYY